MNQASFKFVSKEMPEREKSCLLVCLVACLVYLFDCWLVCSADWFIF
jgi:hypothetical protein